MEVVVPVDDPMQLVASDLKEMFPDTHFVRLPGKRTFAELRSAGFQFASAAIVALTEDQCIPDPDWCFHILQEHSAKYAAIGGAVDKGFQTSLSTDLALNWAVYFCDYSRYANPVLKASAPHLTDCNVSYKREILNSVLRVWEQEFHETQVHAELKKKGELLLLSPSIVVRQQRSLSAGKALRERYIFGRLFGSTRVTGVSLTKRMFYAAASIALPALLTARIAANVHQKKRYRVQFLRSLPWIIVLNLVWSFGELTGYITARPDSSLRPQKVSA
jgi:hypothetical protein